MRIALGLLVMTSACTGASWGENGAGGDTDVDPPPPSVGQHRMGAVAVERDEDQLWVVHEHNRDGVIRANLSAIDPATGATFEVLDVSNTTDRRVVFPAADRMILLAQRDAKDTLVLFDTTTRTQLASVTKPTWYWGTRTAPSGRALVVADNIDPMAPLHVVDTATLAHHEIDHGGELIEAMWNHGEDVLFALSANDPFGPAATARVLRYDLRGADFGATVPAPSHTWTLPGFGWDFAFSYTWISISPDNRWVVFPVIDRREGPTKGTHMLYIVDQQTLAATLVPGMGPVGFTRDSRSIVSYGANATNDGEDLWLIDPVTRTKQVVVMPFAGTLMFHVMRDADYIVCVPVLGGTDAGPAVYDVAANVVRPITMPAGTSTLELYDFITRPGASELWLESNGSVYSLDLPLAALTEIHVDGAASSINVRPLADQAVVGDGTAVTIQRHAMASRARVGSMIGLPSPFVVPAPATISARVAAPELPVTRFAQSAFEPGYQAPMARRPGRMMPAEPRRR